MFGDDADVLANSETGALGYLHKDATPDRYPFVFGSADNSESSLEPDLVNPMAWRVANGYEITLAGVLIDRFSALLQT